MPNCIFVWKYCRIFTMALRPLYKINIDDSGCCIKAHLWRMKSLLQKQIKCSKIHYYADPYMLFAWNYPPTCIFRTLFHSSYMCLHKMVKCDRRRHVHSTQKKQHTQASFGLNFSMEFSMVRISLSDEENRKLQPIYKWCLCYMETRTYVWNC